MDCTNCIVNLLLHYVNCYYHPTHDGCKNQCNIDHYLLKRWYGPSIINYFSCGVLNANLVMVKGSEISYIVNYVVRLITLSKDEVPIASVRKHSNNVVPLKNPLRSEERRVGKECRSHW